MDLILKIGILQICPDGRGTTWYWISMDLDIDEGLDMGWVHLVFNK